MHFPLIRQSLPFTRPLSQGGILVGVIVLAGYMLGLEVAFRPIENGPATHPITAAMLCALAGVTAMWRSREHVWLLRTVSTAVAVIAGIRLMEIATGVALLEPFSPFRTILEQVQAQGRLISIGANTAATYFLLAIASLSVGSSRYKQAQCLAIVALGFPAVGLIGYLYDIPSLYGAMALPTLFGSTLVGLAIFLSSAHRGFLRSVLSPWVTGKVARIQLAFGYTVPVLIGYFLIQVFDELRLGIAVFAVLASGVISAIVFLSIRSVERSEQMRRASQRDLAQSLDELEQHRINLSELVEERTFELLAAKVSAESANRAKTLFLGNMSHEMQTPIHQISGLASMFKRDSLTEKQAHRVGLIETATNRLNSVISGILTLVDIEARSTAVKLNPVNIERLIIDVSSMVSKSARKKGIGLEHHVANLPSNLLGDTQHLTTILSCFYNNAITFSDQGSVRTRVLILDEDAGSVTIRIEVHDEGIGIAPEHVTRLFEPFEQADNSHTRKYGGIGVGLAIVKELAKLMGGDAGCHSVVGQGSTFWITVRLVKAVTICNDAKSEYGDFQI